jgi:hypothetical protein
LSKWIAIATNDEKLTHVHTNYPATLAHNWHMSYAAVLQFLRDKKSATNDLYCYYINPTTWLNIITLEGAGLGGENLQCEGYLGLWLEDVLDQYEYSDYQLSKYAQTYVAYLYDNGKHLICLVYLSSLKVILFIIIIYVIMQTF